MPGRRRATSRAWSASACPGTGSAIPLPACGGISRRNTPNLRLELRFYSENGLLRALDDHMADFVLAFGRPRADNVGRQSLSVSQICAVLPGGHPLAGAGELSFSQLRHEAFLVPDYKISGVEFDTVVTYAGRNGFDPTWSRRRTPFPEIFTMVACGCGIAVLSELYRFSAGEHVVFVPREISRPARSICSGGSGMTSA